MNYLIAGTGGVGGSIAAFLALAGKDVTCIARGEHLAAIREHGLQLHSDLKGEHTLHIPACTAEEYQGKADVIFVCVKGYSVDSITDLIRRAAKPDTVVIPILNVYGTGPRIQRLVPGVTVLDGTGWYSKGDVKVLVVLAYKRQSHEIFQLVKDVDPNAFVSQSSVIGVYGEGFDRLKAK